MRSGFEVMYALFLESQDSRWQYEPRMFILASGKRYTPDFYLPDTNEWVEIKGVLSEASRQKIGMFREQGFKLTLVFETKLKQLSPVRYSQIKNHCLAQAVSDSNWNTNLHITEHSLS
jgi:hypothetical protein